MQAILATAIRPIVIPNSTTIQPERFQSSNNFFRRELYFRGNLIYQKIAFWAKNTRNPKTMIDSMRTPMSTSENGVQAFEQEAFIEGPSDSGAVGLEGTLNSLETLPAVNTTESRESSRKSSIDESLNPYFLHHSDSLGLILVAQPLTGENYTSVSRATLIALFVMNKLGFVDRSIEKPEGTGLDLLNSWTRNKNIAISWILYSVSKEISASVIYAESAMRYGSILRTVSNKEMIEFFS